MMKEILSERELYKQGSYRRIVRWYKGWCEGLRIKGWQGQETIIEKDAVTALETFMVNGNYRKATTFNT